MIRSLLVDNYDSYTYNLFDLMARVNGVEPIVLRNDDPRCLVEAERVDCVVISPGPGDPRQPDDFGVCGRLLDIVRVPVLGVCLGHQGIGAAFGAKVTRAPKPRHGFVSQVKHNRDELLNGIPQGFATVRYHSLCVEEPLPPDIEPIAWAEDGVLMGLRHRSRPLWGVQFHPESVLTEYGARLLDNFADIVCRHHGRLRSADADQHHRYTVHMRVLNLVPPGDAVFAAVFGGRRHVAWLDSAAKGPGSGRFSYMAQASPALGEVFSYRRQEGEVRIEEVGRGRRTAPGSVFDVLDTELARRVIVTPEVPFDFTGGLIGYFGYELKSDAGATAEYASDVPDAVWIFPDRVLAVDHDDQRIYLLALSDDDPSTQDAAQRWLESAAELVGVVAADAEPAPSARIAGHRNTDPLRSSVEMALARDGATYLADIAHCVDKLLAGETYEVCLTNMLRLPRPPDSFEFHCALRRRNPAPYAAYLRFDEVEVACSSPERFLKVTRDRVVEAKPIKGTAPRGASEAEDLRLRIELSSSTKTRAENLMIVDLLRNDLNRVCIPGSVHVPALMRVESYATVHQLVSTIRGRLRDDVSAVACARACFPGGSMTGAPKLRTMQIIDGLESEARGIYSGSLGFVACNGTADLNIVIRTAVFTENEVRIGAGGAITLDSDPDEEYEEMLLKAMAPLSAYMAGNSSPAKLFHLLAESSG